MGRRPNVIVSTYFLRGDKLEDASNRYAHTCRKCGELFPKGRVDNLVQHLLRRCPSISQEDRHYVWYTTQNQDPGPYRSIDSFDNQEYEAPNHDHDMQYSSDSLLAQREQSALDTLAEVSRRHLNYSKPQNDPDDTGESSAWIQHPYAIKGNSPLNEVNSNSDVHMHQSGSKATTSASPLIQTASAANDHLEGLITNMKTPPISEPLSSGINVPNVEIPPTPLVSNDMTWSSTNSPNSFGDLMATIPPLYQQPPGVLQRTLKNKARSKFTENRRQEVQENRKRGACMRCRMLKKPCSDGTPCNTCNSVGSARIWKGKCLRTRLADEFTLWSTGLFHSKTKIEASAAVHNLDQHTTGGQIDAFLFSNPKPCMTFATRRYHVRPQKDLTGPYDDNGIDPNLRRAQAAETTDLFVLDEKVDLPKMIGEYVNRASDACIDQDGCKFMKATLQRAQEMICAEEQIDTTEKRGERRSCYSRRDQLLSNVVALWRETAMLTSPNRNNVKLLRRPVETTDQSPESDIGELSNQTSKELSPQSERLIYLQLLAAIEARCDKLSKVVMNELERRLLQRQQVSRFATFISSVILLNCIERMSGMYRTFDPTAGEQIPLPKDWPLHESPRKLWQQGEHFAELLVMLLRMRALPPKTASTPDGKLVVHQDLTLPIPIDGPPVKNEQVTVSGEWLDSMDLMEKDLIRIRDGETPMATQYATAWDLRFVSKLLLPEKIWLP